VSIRVVVIASVAAHRAALAATLRTATELRLVASTASVSPALDRFEADVWVVALPDERLRRVLQRLARAPAPAPVVVVDSLRRRATREDGVRAVLPPDAGSGEVVAAVRAAAAGLLIIHPAAAIPGRRRPAAALEAPATLQGETLTARELEVLRLMADGLGNKGIAARLGVSMHTAKFHVASILGKLGASTRTGAVTLGIRRGLVVI
jgi:DNA-binding NarL/FixJ family response regulator